LIAIEATAASEIQALAAVDKAFAAIDQLGLLLHPTRRSSDLRRIASARQGESVCVHPWTFAVLARSRELHELTAGVFDPCTPEASGRLSDVDLDTRDHVTCQAPVSIDLGGIAKGFAVDRAIETLQTHGCVAGLVNAGGDVRVFGAQPRPLIVRPAANAAITIELANGALAVSAPRSGSSPAEHRGYYDGATRRSVTGRTVAIAAGEAGIADALTKCVMLCSEETANSVLHRYGARHVQIQVSP
jgi:thiamine biosynthesis lipoprotein